MAKIISIFNHAGGTGKSTLTQNLGHQLAVRGNRTLLIDFDPQGSLSIFCGLDPMQITRTLREPLLSETPQLDETLPLIEELENLHLIPTNLLFAEVEQELVIQMNREVRLKDVLAPLRRRYDFIVIDCPPSLGLLSINALAASTHLIIPIQTQFKATIAINGLLRTYRLVRDRLNKNLRIAGVVPMIHDNTSHSGETLSTISSTLGEVATVFEPIPKSAVFPVASQRGLPVARHSRDKRYQHIIQLFDRLAKAVEEL
jgi:chromosome partitioning protein